MVISDISNKDITHKLTSLPSWQCIFEPFKFFIKWANTGLIFVYFRSIHIQILQNGGVSGSQTCKVGVEGEHADHLTTTAQ